jgi:urease accessory protein
MEQHMASRISRTALSILILGLGSGIAEAHTGISDTIGFSHGFGHPFSGLDHILAMVAVGLFAARLGGQSFWLVPAAFVAMMAVGGTLGISVFDVPFVELGIAASVIVLGLAVALQLNLPTIAAMALVGFFAVFHGHAHGSEMPSAASGLTYALGFMLATAMLHAVGIGIGLGTGRFNKTTSAGFARVAGSAMAVAGVGILTGYI